MQDNRRFKIIEKGTLENGEAYEVHQEISEEYYRLYFLGRFFGYTQRSAWFSFLCGYCWGKGINPAAMKRNRFDLEE